MRSHAREPCHVARGCRLRYLRLQATDGVASRAWVLPLHSLLAAEAQLKVLTYFTYLPTYLLTTFTKAQLKVRTGSGVLFSQYLLTHVFPHSLISLRT